jgi:hypothetical protein
MKSTETKARFVHGDKTPVGGVLELGIVRASERRKER